MSTRAMNVKDQVSFKPSEQSCSNFRSNPFARTGKIVRKCVDCGEDISAHHRDAVSLVSVRKVVESNSKIPNEISRGLFLGGFQAAMNVKFLKDENVKLVVNTAGTALERHFPSFGKLIESPVFSELGIDLVRCEWVDSVEQEIHLEEIQFLIVKIYETLHRGHAVLVHCAQGRSRSSTLILAYLMSTTPMAYNEALEHVQSKRSMAQPNEGFEKQLKSWELRNKHLSQKV
jgi:hypothetical protein